MSFVGLRYQMNCTKDNPYRRSLTGQKRELPSDNSMLVTPETRQQQQGGAHQQAATAKRNKMSITKEQVDTEDDSGGRRGQHVQEAGNAGSNHSSERQEPATGAECGRDVNNSFEGSLALGHHQQQQQNQAAHIERRRLHDAFVSPASSVGPSVPKEEKATIKRRLHDAFVRVETIPPHVQEERLETKIDGSGHDSDANSSSSSDEQSFLSVEEGIDDEEEIEIRTREIPQSVLRDPERLIQLPQHYQPSKESPYLPQLTADGKPSDMEHQLEGEQQQQQPSEVEEYNDRHIRYQKHWLPVYRRCAGCTLSEEVAEVWCCECSRCLCRDCDERMHGVDALDPLSRPMCSHRVEYILGGGGVPILSPLLEILVLGLAMWSIKPLWTNAGHLLHVDYFFESICPLVYRIRRVVFRIDHALYPLVKGSLSNWCDIEDSFIKIFSDLWVRGILTHTDSFALLILKAPTTIGALIMVLAIVPLLAIPYAALATLVRVIETVLFPNWFITRLIARIIRITTVLIWLPIRLLGWCCRSTILGLAMDQDYKEHFHRRIKIPPKTGHVKRPVPSHSILDISLVGCPTRITRVFYYFHRKARRAIIGTILTLVFIAVSTRIVLLSMPRCGNGLLSKYAEQEMWSMIANEREPTPQCVSIDVIARKFSQRIGVQIPQFESLGDEGLVLARMQDATENDYIDDVLRKFSSTIIGYVMNLEFWIQMTAVAMLGIVAFSGLFRRLAFWADLQRRYRYRIQKKSRSNVPGSPATRDENNKTGISVQQGEVIKGDDLSGKGIQNVHLQETGS